MGTRQQARNTRHVAPRQLPLGPGRTSTGLPKARSRTHGHHPGVGRVRTGDRRWVGRDSTASARRQVVVGRTKPRETAVPTTSDPPNSGHAGGETVDGLSWPDDCATPTTCDSTGTSRYRDGYDGSGPNGKTARSSTNCTPSRPKRRDWVAVGRRIDRSRRACNARAWTLRQRDRRMFIETG